MIKFSSQDRYEMISSYSKKNRIMGYVDKYFVGVIACFGFIGILTLFEAVGRSFGVASLIFMIGSFVWIGIFERKFYKETKISRPMWKLDQLGIQVTSIGFKKESYDLVEIHTTESVTEISFESIIHVYDCRVILEDWPRKASSERKLSILKNESLFAEMVLEAFLDKVVGIWSGEIEKSREKQLKKYWE